MKANKLKQIVKEKYAQIAEQSKEQNQNACCGTNCCDTVNYSVFADDYAQLQGYNPEADLGLGCGLPTEYAQIKEGDTVVDLGSGAGNDCFVARAITGERGRVIGLDMTEKMIEKARANAQKLGYENVEFLLGDIENMPIPADTADIVVSNCVLNLVPDKVAAFRETYRILKPGGHFSISDVVIEGVLPENLQKDAEMYVGCVAGALPKKEYLKMIADAGFRNIKIQKEKEIQLPDALLEKYLFENELKVDKTSGIGIYSITVYAER